MEYYISQIALTHDGGQETLIEEYWILANAARFLKANLGLHPINEIEGISFYIGVEESFNHEDPTAYPSNHPLAPQFPSMHWGWASGYRFAAMEGYGGVNYNQNYQLHGLGDDKYYQVQIDLDNLVAVDEEIEINLDADYIRALKNIEVNSGIIEHGGIEEAHELLKNMRDYVFSASPVITSTSTISDINLFDVYPNPSFGDNTQIAFSTTGNLNYSIEVVNILGQHVQGFYNLHSNVLLDLKVKQSGIYLINLMKAGQIIDSKKLIKY